MTHKNIKRFSIVGEFQSDAEIPQTRTTYEQFLTKDIRYQGYIPVLDLDTAWSTSYDIEGDRWFFTLTIQAIYVGKRKAKQWEGISGSSLIPRSIPKAT